MISKDTFIEANLEPNFQKIKDLADRLHISTKNVKQLKKTYMKEIEEIQNARNIFKRKKYTSSGKENVDFEFKDFREFYSWYTAQLRVCGYCGIEEIILKDLYDSDILSTKRKRGRTLEIERKDSKNNKYSPDNCILACYFCNNHKSDIISEEDHRKYFAKDIEQYLRDKHRSSKPLQ